jgi:hypothetical protein
LLESPKKQISVAQGGGEGLYLLKSKRRHFSVDRAKRELKLKREVNKSLLSKTNPGIPPATCQASTSHQPPSISSQLPSPTKTSLNHQRPPIHSTLDIEVVFATKVY